MPEKFEPSGYKHESQLIYGMRPSHPGLLEIKIHNPSKMNAISNDPEKKIGEIVTAAQTDDTVKVILIHGGSFFSSGNDLSMFMKPMTKELLQSAENSVKNIMVGMLLALNTSIKPIVMVVRGAAIGIGCTMTAHSTFLYTSPEARFMTPFMKSSQSPEGTSTFLFP